jgi:hypothetical protein
VDNLAHCVPGWATLPHRGTRQRAGWVRHGWGARAGMGPGVDPGGSSAAGSRGCPGDPARDREARGARVPKVQWWSPPTSAEARGNEREPSDWPGRLAGCRLAPGRLPPGHRSPGHLPPGHLRPGHPRPGHLADDRLARGRPALRPAAAPGRARPWPPTPSAGVGPGWLAGVGPGLCDRRGCGPCRRCGGGMLGGWRHDAGWGRGPGVGHWGGERLDHHRLGSWLDVDHLGHLGHGGVGRRGQDGGLGRGPWRRGGCDGAGAGAVPVPGGRVSGPVRADSP